MFTPRASKQHQKHRSADHRSEQTNRHFEWQRDRPRDNVGQDDHRSPTQCARWQEHPVARADENSHSVRDHQPDEADTANRCNRNSDSCSRQSPNDEAETLHIDTEVARLAFAE
jgi:hypothetical protein